MRKGPGRPIDQKKLRSVLKAVEAGKLTTKEIAEKFGITAQTVRNYIKRDKPEAP